MRKPKRYLSERYNIVIARSTQEIEALRDIWEKMQTHPNSDIDFYLTIINSLSRVIRPHVILISKDGIPSALAVGRIEDFEFKCNFGYKTLYKTTVRAFTIIYEGILGDASPENCKILLTEFDNVLKQGEADIIYLSNIKSDSPLYDLARTIPSYLFRDHFPISNVHLKMTVPPNMDAFFSARSRKHRYWLRRLERVLEKEYPGNITTKYFFEEKDLNQLFTDAELVSQKTYQRRLDAGFIDNETTRNTYSLLANKSLLRAYLLYIGEKPSAYWIGHQYGDTFHLGSTGYDPALRDYELGTILFLKMIEDLCSIKELKFIDFGFGDASYKRRFGDQSWNETSIYIFARSLRGISLNIAGTITSMIYQFSIVILKRVGLLEKVKRGWRTILSNKATGIGSDQSESHRK